MEQARNRRKVSRVNYTEELLSDLHPLDEHDPSVRLVDASTKVVSDGGDAGAAKSAPKTANSNPSIATKKDTNAKEADDYRVPLNWQRKYTLAEHLAGVMSLTSAWVDEGILHLDDGTTYSPDGMYLSPCQSIANHSDYVYLLSEPPGEPYYIARIMEFVYKPEEPKHLESKPDEKQKRKRRTSRTTMKMSAEHYMVRVNWLYRPRDLSKPVSDSRMLYVSMASAVCPIASIRGKCTVRHRDHIKDMDDYRRTPNSFWFDKLFDLYILRFFDVVPTEKMINYPAIVYEALCARFKYAIMEPGRAKELCATPCDCAKCQQWCSTEDSIICVSCKSSYHMSCLNPPLARKPRHGFAWSCAPCNRIYETRIHGSGDGLPEASPLDAIVPLENGSSLSPPPKTRYEELEAIFSDRKYGKRFASLTDEQKHQLKLWPFRYLGVNAKIEDILDLEDRIYPRAVSRIGTKHQANVQDWERTVIYYESERSEKRSKKTKAIISASKPAKILTPVSKEEESELSLLLSLPKKDKPVWFQERPAGYLERGGDDTVSLLWKPPQDLNLGSSGKDQCDLFLESIATVAHKIGVKPYTPNFLDASLKAYMESDYSIEATLPKLKSLTKKSLKEPILTQQEVALFEQGVSKFGSELSEVAKYVKSKKPADIVRYYYMWKKTPQGHRIWDNFEGRKRNVKARKVRAEGELIDSVADLSDDSKFSVVKAQSQDRSFICKHCHTTESEVWQRASGFLTANNQNPIIALCLRCAILWRRYAVVWESPDEVAKKISKSGTKRLLEDELIKDGEAILAERAKPKEAVPRKKAKLINYENKPSSGKTKRSLSHVSDSSFSSLSSLSSLSSVSEESDRNLNLESDILGKLSSKQAAGSLLSPDVKSSGKSAKSRTKGIQKTHPRQASSSSSPSDISLGDNSPDSSQEGKKCQPPRIILRIPASKLGSKSKVKKEEKINIKTEAKVPIGQRLITTFWGPNTGQNGNGATLISSNVSQIKNYTPEEALKTPEKLPSSTLHCNACGVMPISFPSNANLTPLGSTWLCDQCRDEESILSPRDCILCPATSLSFDTNGSDDEYVAPNEMIRLPAGWAHLKCAIWSQCDSRPLIPDSPPQQPANCKFCSNTSGVAATCRHCQSTFHISCAEKAHYKFRFNLEAARPGSSTPSFSFNGKDVTVKPAVLCNDTSIKRSMHLPLECDKATGKSLLNLYVDHCLTHGMKRPVSQGARRTPTKVNLVCKDPVGNKDINGQTITAPALK